jgi:hypothetical protein
MRARAPLGGLTAPLVQAEQNLGPMNTLITSQLGEIPAQHLKHSGMARPQRHERSRLLDLLELAQESRAEVQGIGVSAEYPTIRCKDHPGDSNTVRNSATPAAHAS